MSFLLLVVVVAAGWLLVTLQAAEGTTTTSSKTRVLLVAVGEEDPPLVLSAIEELRASGFEVTDDLEAAFAAADAPDAEAFIVTRAAFDEVPPEVWSRVHGAGVIVGGIDVSLHELQPLATGIPAGWARLAYTPGQPIFSLIRGGNCEGAISDWLKNWSLQGLVQHYEDEDCSPTPLSV